MKDKRIVRIALFLILVAFSLVYALYFMVQEDNAKGDFKTIFLRRGVVTSGDVAVSGTPGNGQMTNTGAIGNALSSGGLLSGQTTGELDVYGEASEGNGGVGGIGGSGNVGSSVGTLPIVSDSSNSFLSEVLGTTSGGQILPGSELYYGSLDILNILGLRYEYILKDKTHTIFYVYFGKKGFDYNLPELARSLGGETVEIYAKNDIINNLYFGDRVTILTLPNQLPTQMNVFVRMGEDLWLIEDLTGKYRENKRHIRYIFTNK